MSENFVAKCALCDAEACEIHVIFRLGAKDLGICKGCACSKEHCAWCDRTGDHWLGCPVVGLPEERDVKPVMH